MQSAQYRRKALLIISDGGDNHSRHHLKEIKRVLAGIRPPGICDWNLRYGAVQVARGVPGPRLAGQDYRRYGRPRSSLSISHLRFLKRRRRSAGRSAASMFLATDQMAPSADRVRRKIQGAGDANRRPHGVAHVLQVRVRALRRYAFPQPVIDHRFAEPRQSRSSAQSRPAHLIEGGIRAKFGDMAGFGR